eukprot:Hpha_TRINITY_DN13914_c0_g1::TRINITY_DN13914_c0_g1_i1::g.35466::m.35466
MRRTPPSGDAAARRIGGAAWVRGNLSPGQGARVHRTPASGVPSTPQTPGGGMRVPLPRMSAPTARAGDVVWGRDDRPADSPTRSAQMTRSKVLLSPAGAVTHLRHQSRQGGMLSPPPAGPIAPRPISPRARAPPGLQSPSPSPPTVTTPAAATLTPAGGGCMTPPAPPQDAAGPRSGPVAFTPGLGVATPPMPMVMSTPVAPQEGVPSGNPYLRTTPPTDLPGEVQVVAPYPNPRPAAVSTPWLPANSAVPGPGPISHSPAPQSFVMGATGMLQFGMPAHKREPAHSSPPPARKSLDPR